MKKDNLLNSLSNKYFKILASPGGRVAAGILWVLITLFFGYQIKGLKIDFEFEKLFPRNDPDLQFYLDHHLRHFGYDNDYLVIILENETGIFKRDFLEKTHEILDALDKISGVKSINSPVNLGLPIKGPLGFTPVPLIHVDNPDKYSGDSARIFSHPVFSGFFSPDGKSVLVRLVHEHLDKDRSAKLVREVKKAIGKSGFDEYRLVGKLVAQQYFIWLIKRDFVVFITAALVISFLLLLLILRSVRGTLLPFLVSITSLIWLLGIISLSGMKISILGSLIPPIILFISTSDAIHLIHAYKNNNGDVAAGVRQVFLPAFLTSLTTSFGFFSLITINNTPTQVFGLFTAIGVAIAFVITFCFGPFFLKNASRTHKSFLDPRKVTVKIIKARIPILAGSALAVILSIAGLARLKIDARLLSDLPDHSQVKRNFEYADTVFGGSKPWEMSYWPADTGASIWDHRLMKEAEKIHHYLKNEYPVGRVWSPVSLVKLGNQMLNGGTTEAFAFPKKQDMKETVRLAEKLDRLQVLPGVVANAGRYARFIGYVPELGSANMLRKNQQLLRFLEANVDPAVINYRITGTVQLMNKSHALLSKDMIKGLLMAIALVSIALAIYFRSFMLLGISLIANLIPILVTGGIMGISGIDLQLTISILFAISFGIAVDDTIHFISAYKKNRGTPVFRLIKTYRQTGHAIIVTSIIIISGFCLLLLSSFGATYYLGLFLCTTLVAALLIDLTLLPLLLIAGNRKSKPLSPGDPLPDLTLKNQDGETVRLHDYLNKHPLVVYFYPKDETPGCTKEACSFRNRLSDFTDRGAKVFGISGDTVTVHKKFHQKYGLNFDLLSDTGRSAERAFGVSRNLLGLLPGRVTFIFDQSGKLIHRFSSATQPIRHIDEALKALDPGQ